MGWGVWEAWEVCNDEGASSAVREQAYPVGGGLEKGRKTAMYFNHLGMGRKGGRFCEVLYPVLVWGDLAAATMEDGCCFVHKCTSRGLIQKV